MEKIVCFKYKKAIKTEFKFKPENPVKIKKQFYCPEKEYHTILLS